MTRLKRLAIIRMTLNRSHKGDYRLRPPQADVWGLEGREELADLLNYNDMRAFDLRREHRWNIKQAVKHALCRALAQITFTVWEV